MEQQEQPLVMDCTVAEASAESIPRESIGVGEVTGSGVRTGVLLKEVAESEAEVVVSRGPGKRSEQPEARAGTVEDNNTCSQEPLTTSELASLLTYPSTWNGVSPQKHLEQHCRAKKVRQGVPFLRGENNPHFLVEGGLIFIPCVTSSSHSSSMLCIVSWCVLQLPTPCYSLVSRRSAARSFSTATCIIPHLGVQVRTRSHFSSQPTSVKNAFSSSSSPS